MAARELGFGAVAAAAGAIYRVGRLGRQLRALFIGPRPAGAARSRGAAGLGRVPVRPELGDDPDRRAPPVGGLRERRPKRVGPGRKKVNGPA